MASWMARKLSDAEREAQAKEIRPGVLASPWERGVCRHGRSVPERWVWRKGEGIEHADGEIGANGCAKCKRESEEE